MRVGMRMRMVVISTESERIKTHLHKTTANASMRNRVGRDIICIIYNNNRRKEK